MNTEPSILQAARMLTYRLARLSVDSGWARRSSGLRGSLLKEIDHVESLLAQPLPLKDKDLQHLEELVLRGFKIIEAAAREIRSIDDLDDLRRLIKQ